jgi:hypothetical protein
MIWAVDNAGNRTMKPRLILWSVPRWYCAMLPRPAKLSHWQYLCWERDDPFTIWC